eukprot:810010-Pelagomonas_calceolata.AAC.1
MKGAGTDSRDSAQSLAAQESGQQPCLMRYQQGKTNKLSQNFVKLSRAEKIPSYMSCPLDVPGNLEALGMVSHASSGRPSSRDTGMVYLGLGMQDAYSSEVQEVAAFYHVDLDRGLSDRDVQQARIKYGRNQMEAEQSECFETA